MRRIPEGPAVLSVSDVKASHHFVDLWKRIGIQQIIPNPGFSQMSYDLFYPSLKQKLRTGYADNVVSIIPVLRHVSVKEKMVVA